MLSRRPCSWDSVRFSGPVLSQSWICSHARGRLAPTCAGAPSTNWLITRVSMPTTAARPAISTIAVASDRGIRARSSSPTSGREQRRRAGSRSTSGTTTSCSLRHDPEHGQRRRPRAAGSARPRPPATRRPARHVEVVAVRHRGRRHDDRRRRRRRRWRGRVRLLARPPARRPAPGEPSPCRSGRPGGGCPACRPADPRRTSQVRASIHRSRTPRLARGAAPKPGAARRTAYAVAVGSAV